MIYHDVDFSLICPRGKAIMVLCVGNIVILIGIDVNQAFYKTGIEMIQ